MDVSTEPKKKVKKKRKALKITLLIVLGVIIIISVLFSIYFYKCTHYWQADMQKTLDAGFETKQVTLSDGSVINYAEGPDNGDALLLIHGQTCAWDDYTRVLPKLSENWHVYAVDCYGHGDSSHNPKKYYLKENGDDLIWFINNVIKENTVVSGHSSGGLIASYVAAYGGDKVICSVLEDPPVFSTEKGYFENPLLILIHIKIFMNICKVINPSVGKLTICVIVCGDSSICQALWIVWQIMHKNIMNSTQTKVFSSSLCQKI